MTRKFIYIFFLIAIIVSLDVAAQRDTTLTQEVEVTKAYNPTISDANKINEMPRMDESESQVPTFNYSIMSKPILNTFSVNPLKAATIDHRTKKDTGKGLVRAGVGNYNKPYGELFFNTVTSKNSLFGLHAKHLSSHGNLTLEGGNEVSAPYSKNQAEVYYKQNFTRSILSADLYFDHDRFNYYGYPVKEIPGVLLAEDQDITYQGAKQAFSRGGLDLRLKNPVAEKDDPVFNFDLRYQYFETKTEQFEHFGEFKADFQKPFNTGSLIGEVGVNYILTDGNFNRVDIDNRQQTLVFVKPAYYIEGKRASISIGFNGWFDIQDNQDAVAKVTPNVHAKVALVEDAFDFFAGVDGSYENNHYSKIALENQFVDPMHNVENSFEKLHFYGGFDGKFSSKTNFKIGADYSRIDRQPLYFLHEYFYPEPNVNPSPLIINNVFDVLYDDISLLKAGLEVFHSSSEKLEIVLSGNYYLYGLKKQEFAWNMPEWDATVSLAYQINERLDVGADFYLLGARKAMIREWNVIMEEVPVNAELPHTDKIYTLGTTFDLNVNATYMITQKFSVFGQLNNFGFQDYQRWFGYPVQSLNALVGVSYSF